MSSSVGFSSFADLSSLNPTFTPLQGRDTSSILRTTNDDGATISITGSSSDSASDSGSVSIGLSARDVGESPEITYAQSFAIHAIRGSPYYVESLQDSPRAVVERSAMVPGDLSRSRLSRVGWTRDLAWTNGTETANGTETGTTGATEAIGTANTLDNGTADATSSTFDNESTELFDNSTDSSVPELSGNNTDTLVPELSGSNTAAPELFGNSTSIPKLFGNSTNLDSSVPANNTVQNSTLTEPPYPTTVSNYTFSGNSSYLGLQALVQGPESGAADPSQIQTIVPSETLPDLTEDDGETGDVSVGDGPVNDSTFVTSDSDSAPSILTASDPVSNEAGESNPLAGSDSSEATTSGLSDGLFDSSDPASDIGSSQLVTGKEPVSDGSGSGSSRGSGSNFASDSSFRSPNASGSPNDSGSSGSSESSGASSGPSGQSPNSSGPSSTSSGSPNQAADKTDSSSPAKSVDALGSPLATSAKKTSGDRASQPNQVVSDSGYSGHSESSDTLRSSKSSDSSSSDSSSSDSSKSSSSRGSVSSASSQKADVWTTSSESEEHSKNDSAGSDSVAADPAADSPDSDSTHGKPANGQQTVTQTVTTCKTDPTALAEAKDVRKTVTHYETVTTCKPAPAQSTAQSPAQVAVPEPDPLSVPLAAPAQANSASSTKLSYGLLPVLLILLM